MPKCFTIALAIAVACWKSLFAPVQTSSETKVKLEIWGKAQRESARRLKSDWGKLEEGGKIFPASKSRGPNSNALLYAERALST